MIWSRYLLWKCIFSPPPITLSYTHPDSIPSTFFFNAIETEENDSFVNGLRTYFRYVLILQCSNIQMFEDSFIDLMVYDRNTDLEYCKLFLDLLSLENMIILIILY